MKNLLRNIDNGFSQLDPLVDDLTGELLVEIRNVNKNDQSLTMEFSNDTLGFRPTDLLKNNDSLEAFYAAFNVCLQQIEVDCDATLASSESSLISIDSAKKYRVTIEGVSKVLFGDALVSYLSNLSNISITLYE